jgi:peptidoglycan/xylan/chitin deacetylase (PgdA/CDA1 family)
MKSKIKKIIILFCYYSGLNWIFGKFSCHKIFLVGYHSVCDEKNKKEFSQELYQNVSNDVKDFEKQILFLKNNGHSFIHFADLEKPETKKLIKPTVIFFDDGFKDVLVNASPILKKYNIPATIFITTGLVEREFLLWTIQLREFLSKKGYKTEYIEKEISKFKKLGMRGRNSKLKVLYSQNNFTPQPQNLDIFLTWSEIIELSKNNFEIGSHGTIHEKLVELPDDILEGNLVNSKNKLEEICKQTISAFSYPYGRCDESVIAKVKSVGYKFAVSGLSGSESLDNLPERLFALRRIEPKPEESFALFAVRVYMSGLIRGL